MEARRIRLQGELGISRKAIAQGMPECSDCTCMLVCVSLCASCTRDRGGSVHPAFPAPSLRDSIDAKLGLVEPRDRESVSIVGWVERTDTDQCRGAWRWG